jgi:hypothetical protein
MNNLCPGCETAYSVQPQHVGRRITCKKCGAGLVVEADGLHMTSPPTPPAPSDENPVVAVEPPPPALEPAPRLVRPRASFNLSAALKQFFDGYREMISTLLFAMGTLLVILFVFLPVIDQAKVARAQARTRDEAAAAPDKPAIGKGPEQAQKEVRDAENAAVLARYWYDWGMLAGFLLLAGGSLGYLGSPNSQIKRVLGCIILAGQLLLVFLIIVIGRNAR